MSVLYHVNYQRQVEGAGKNVIEGNNGQLYKKIKMANSK